MGPLSPEHPFHLSAVLAVATGVVLLPPIVVALVVLFRRRHHLPIRPRLPWALIGFAVFQLAWTMCNIMERVYLQVYPCWIYLLFGNMFCLLGFDFIAVRMFAYCYLHRVMNEKMAIHRGEEVSAKWSSRRRLLSTRFLLSVVGVLAVLQCLPLLTVVAAVPSVRDGTETVDDCPHETIPALSTTAWVALFGIYSIYTALQLRGVLEDAWRIKTEFRILGILALVAAIAWPVMQSIPTVTRWEGEHVKLSSFLHIYASILGVYVSVVWPVILSYKDVFRVHEQSRVSEHENSSVLQELCCVSDTAVVGDEHESLAALLNSPEGREAFWKHLQKEFSVENLMFLESATAFRKQTDDISRDTFTQACALYRKYMAPEAVFEVNVSITTKHGVEAPLSAVLGGLDVLRCGELQDMDVLLEEAPSVPLQMFDDAIVEVYGLLARDSFLRFVASRQHSDLIKRRSQAEQQRDVLQMLETS